jgi:cell division protein FtsB
VPTSAGTQRVVSTSQKTDASSPPDIVASSGGGTSVTTRAAVLLGVLAILAASYALPVRAWLDQREQLSEVAEQRDVLQAEVAELREAVALWEEPAYVRAQARERLNYVLPGEVGLVVLGTESTAPPEPATGAVVPVPEGDQPWWSTLVSAFAEVGNAEALVSTDPAAEPADTSIDGATGVGEGSPAEAPTSPGGDGAPADES